MAKQTNVNLRNKSVYQVFLRQHSKTQDIKGLIRDLDRIKEMGFDIVYLLPFHPIGEKARKGSVGSPYSIVDYYAIDPLHGTLDDFILLKEEVNKRGMKLMIDIVFNHTSRDSVLLKEKPEWFYKDEDGNFANRVGDWSDITDLDFRIKDVWIYLIDVLKYWANYVDGFRCDVAPLLPIEFWEEARDQVDLINPNIIWLTESVEHGFVKYIRDIGFDASSDSTMYDVFDVCYDYDIYSHMNNFLNGTGTLSRWLEEILLQESTYPKNYVKLRSFENHDQERIASKTSSENQLIHLTSMMFFIKGMPMVYAGQEHLIDKRPELFENDLIKWNSEKSIERLITTLNKIKKNNLFSTGVFNLENKDEAIFSYHNNKEYILGVFNLLNKNSLEVPLKDGNYINVINNKEIKVLNGFIDDLLEPVIIMTDYLNKNK